MVREHTAAVNLFCRAAANTRLASRYTIQQLKNLREYISSLPGLEVKFKNVWMILDGISEAVIQPTVGNLAVRECYISSLHICLLFS